MKLMLVDDHSLFIQGLQYLLETNGIEITGIAYDGKEALAKARILKPDVVLMDISMPGCSGLDALKLINAEMPGIKVIMLTASEDEEDIFEAVKYGASGYLLKSTNASDLMETLFDIEKDEVALSPGLAKRLLKEFKNDPACVSELYLPEYEEGNKVKLTERQSEILEMVAKGITYKEVGDALGITERTIKYHMGRIIELLHLENRAQVIAYAVQKGLVKEEKDNEKADTL